MKLAHHLTTKLLRARAALMVPYTEILTAEGLTDAQWRVMAAIDENPNMHATHIAEEAGVLGPSMSRIMRHLLAGRNIRMDVDPVDARCVFPVLTDQGKWKVDLIRRKFDAIASRQAADIGIVGHQMLSDLLDACAKPKGPDA